MKQLSKSQRNAVIIMTVTIIAAIVVFVWVNYANDYYRATTTAQKALLGNEKIEVIEEKGYYLFTTKSSEKEESVQRPEKGIVFYPGGKVEETAYAPLLLELAETGYEVYLVKMPAKLAIFGMNAAADIMENAAHIKEWTMMGHSLGGAMAASFSASHDEEVDVLVLLAAYSTEDLSDLEIDVYSIYGSEDKVLNMEKYGEYEENLPDDAKELIIDGGNHANYAHYGNQAGDGEATITREEQQEWVMDFLLSGQDAV